MKIATVIGARPQFIKAAMVSKEINEHNNLSEIIIHTGEHFDLKMSQIFFEEMGIPAPNYNLGIQSLTHGAMTGRQLEGIEKILIKEKPDWLLVYGDTNSTLSGALAAAKLNISIAHVEAGLRSFNRYMPEEINRILTDHISEILFAPTETAKTNLIGEGIGKNKIHMVGDVMCDASLHFKDIAHNNSSIMNDLELNGQSYVLCTVHRQENSEDPERLMSIFKALNMINKERRVLMPLHPRTRMIIRQQGIQTDFEPIEPIGYLNMLVLLMGCDIVFTDSGGLQKEAFYFNKHCVTLRDETEWVELVEHGFNILVGAKTNKIIEVYNKLINKSSDWGVKLYGDGKSRKKIIRYLIE